MQSWRVDEGLRTSGELSERDAKYFLKSIILFYGLHYVCVIRDYERPGVWFRYDDAKVEQVTCYSALH